MEFELDDILDGVPIRFEITHYDAGSPAKLSGHPDDYEPVSGDELEYDMFFVVETDGKEKLIPVPPEVKSRISEYHESDIYDAATECLS